MLRTLKFIWNHPLTRKRRLPALFNFLKWQITSRLVKSVRVHQFTQHSKLRVWKGLTGATGNIYCGLHEFEDMAFLLHFLRPGDLFVDVGANIGSYTILASAEIGADTIAVEPIKETYEHLKQNIKLNHVQDKVTALNMGLGSTKGQLKFTSSYDTGNRVATVDETNVETVDVNTLDHILNSRCPALLKIDVEGFETEVLKGAAATLQCTALKAIIIELNGSGNRYGFSEDAIHNLLQEHGFQVMQYLPFKRNLIASSSNITANALYVRDTDFVKQRLVNARAIWVQQQVI